MNTLHHSLVVETVAAFWAMRAVDGDADLLKLSLMSTLANKPQIDLNYDYRSYSDDLTFAMQVAGVTKFNDSKLESSTYMREGKRVLQFKNGYGNYLEPLQIVT